jgi:hypothetical protein
MIKGVIMHKMGMNHRVIRGEPSAAGKTPYYACGIYNGTKAYRFY